MSPSSHNFAGFLVIFGIFLYLMFSFALLEARTPELPAFEGFGAQTRGGNQTDATIYAVTSLADSGPGSFRQILSEISGPAVIHFEISGTIELLSLIDLPSNITVDGRGKKIFLTKNGLRLANKHNIILLNIGFYDIDGQIGDSIQITDASSQIVIDHCSFDNRGLMPFIEDHPDEQISIVWGSTDITISWCSFRYHDKVLLIGNGNAPPEIDGNIRATLHHNLFEHTGRRHPFLRYGKVDMYNNIILDWTAYIYYPYGSRSQADGELLIEKNWYQQSDPRYLIAAYFQEGGKLNPKDNYRDPKRLVIMPHKPLEVFTRPYSAQIDELNQEWFEKMKLLVGNIL